MSRSWAAGAKTSLDVQAEGLSCCRYYWGHKIDSPGDPAARDFCSAGSSCMPMLAGISVGPVFAAVEVNRTPPARRGMGDWVEQGPMGLFSGALSRGATTTVQS